MVTYVKTVIFSTEEEAADWIFDNKNKKVVWGEQVGNGPFVVKYLTKEKTLEKYDNPEKYTMRVVRKHHN